MPFLNQKLISKHVKPYNLNHIKPTTLPFHPIFYNKPHVSDKNIKLGYADHAAIQIYCVSFFNCANN